METGVASQWRRQGGHFESHIDRRMNNQVFELVDGVEGFIDSPHLPLTDKYFCRNRVAITMTWVVAAILAREAKE